jgi:hypothetical protein
MVIVDQIFWQPVVCEFVYCNEVYNQDKITWWYRNGNQYTEMEEPWRSVSF